MSAAYTHVWRSGAGSDLPCFLTENKGPDLNGNGEIFVQIVDKDGNTTFVLEGELIPIADWQAELAAAVQKTPSTGNGCFTVIQASNPPQVGKTYRLDTNKRLAKTSVASIVAGVATTIDATAENLVAALKHAAGSDNEVILLDSFIGATPGSPTEISIVTEAELERQIGGKIALDPVAGFYTVNGKTVAARLKRLMQSSSWILIDADNPPGMPAQWVGLSLAERLELLEVILPGISKCLRIEYRGSSARVVNGSGKQEPGPTHALIQISNPDMLDLLRAHVHVQSVLQHLSFPSPRYSRKDPSKVVGHAHLTLVDLAVWVLGRLIFNARPDVTGAPGFRVLDTDPQIVNPKGGVLDVSWLTPPSATQAREYSQKTGRTIDPGTGTRGGFAVREDGQLRLDTEIEASGVVKPLGDWLVEMMDADIVKMRCEAAFRASVSEAAFIRITESGQVFVFDAGTSISSYLAPLPTPEEAVATASTLEEYELMEAVRAARDRRNLRQAQAAFLPLPDPSSDDDDKPTPPKLIPHVFVTGKIRPPREFLVKQGWIPMKKVTLLQGDGGDGKSLLMQQLQSSCSTGLPWVGLPVEECISAGFYTEDDDEDVEERQDAIDGYYGQYCADTGKMHVFERDGEENELVVFDRHRRPELTTFYHQMAERVMDLKARLLALDVAVDLYGGNEIVRPEVRALFRPLKALARKMNGAVVMTTHVSQSGIRSDGGHSGSTDWSNAARSRLYLNRPKDDKGNLLDPFARTLTRKKANYASIGETVPLRWHNGILIRDGAYEEDLNRPSAEEVFLAILDAVNAEGQKVGPRLNGNYAPRLFMLRPALDRQGYQRADFERAMQRLLQTGTIKLVPYGPPSDGTQMLVRTPLTTTEEAGVY